MERRTPSKKSQSGWSGVVLEMEHREEIGLAIGGCFLKELAQEVARGGRGTGGGGVGQPSGSALRGLRTGLGGHRRVSGAFEVNRNLVAGEKGRFSRLGFPEGEMYPACMCTAWPAGDRLGKVLSAAWRGVRRSRGGCVGIPAVPLHLCDSGCGASPPLGSASHRWTPEHSLSCSTVLLYRKGET